MRFTVLLSIMSIGVASHQICAKPVIQWQWSGINADWSTYEAEVCLTERGTYAIAGTRGRDIGISCVDKEGGLVWQRTYTTYDTAIQSATEMVHSLQALSGGAFALAGSRTSMPAAGDKDAWILLLDSLGSLIWKKTFGVPWANDPQNLEDPTGASCVREAQNGDLLLSGDSSDTSWMCRLDRQGNTLWSNRYSERGPIETFVELPSGGIVGFGSRVFGPDSSGREHWKRDYGAGPYTIPQASVLTSANTVVVLSMTFTPNKVRYTNRLVCVDTNGVTMWRRSYGDSTTSALLRCFAQMPDSGYILAGSRPMVRDSSDSNARTTHLWLVRTDSKGDTLWTYTTPALSVATSLVTTPDSGYVVAGMLMDGSDVNRADLIKFSEKAGLSIKHRGHILQQTPALRAPVHSAQEGTQLFDLRGRPAGRFTASPVTGNRPTQCAGIYILRKGKNQLGRLVVDSRN